MVITALMIKFWRSLDKSCNLFNYLFDDGMSCAINLSLPFVIAIQVEHVSAEFSRVQGQSTNQLTTSRNDLSPCEIR